MLDVNNIAFGLIVYRIVSLLVGLSIVYLGFRLFVLGVFEKIGDFQAAWGTKKILLKQAAPGVVFALFGATVIVVSLIRGFSLESFGPEFSPYLSSQYDKTIEQALEESFLGEKVGIDSTIGYILQKIIDKEPLTDEDHIRLHRWFTGWRMTKLSSHK